MVYLKAFHLIAIVFWFSGLFYLPRLFVYHTMQRSLLMQQRFSRLEYKLYYYITTPGAIFTILSGIVLADYKFPQGKYPLWFFAKISGVCMLSMVHIYLGYLMLCFAKNKNRNSERFFRYLNEVPTVLLFVIVFFAVFHPWQHN